MTWDPATSNGFESDKVKYDVLPYLLKGGLDLGCGPAKVWPHLIGVDSGKDVQLFGVRMKPDMVLPDCASLGIFADGSMESLFSSHLLEHIEDWHGALREWWRVLKVGGYLVLYLPHRDLYPRIGQPGANPDHKHDFDEDLVLDFCRLAFPDWTLHEKQVRGERDEYSFLLVLRKGAAGSGQQDATVRPGKRAGIVRLGGNGDALWAGSVAANLHAQGYAVTGYVGVNGEAVLRHDPHFAELITLPSNLLADDELIAFFAHQAARFDKWVNLIGSVETRLLPHQSSQDFYLPHGVRHTLMNHNYLDMVHAYAEIEGAPVRQTFYPTEKERAWAKDMRAKLPGRVVLVSATGSGPFKAWPHAQEFMRLMALDGIYTVLVGDLKHLPDIDPQPVRGVEYGHVVGQEWPLRLALAYALECDAVVGTESVFANAVAYEPIPKVVMLSHSSHENLTRDWPNTVALEAPVACHPCHRIHNVGAVFCPKDTVTGAAACMAHYGPQTVADLVRQALGIEQRAAA